MFKFWEFYFSVTMAPDDTGSGGSDPAPASGGSDAGSSPGGGDAAPSLGAGGSDAAASTPDPIAAREKAETDRKAFLDAAFERGMKRHNEAKGIEMPDGAGSQDQENPDDTDPLAGGIDDIHPDDPRRRKDGTFRSKDPAQAGEDPAASEADGAVDPAATEDRKPQAPVVPVPAAWSREMHEEFAKLTPAAQRYVARREEQISEGFKRLGPVAKFGSEIAEVVELHRDYFESKPNLRASQVLGNYLNFDRLLATNPAAAICQVAEVAGIDIVALAQALVQNKFNPREALLQHQVEMERNSSQAQARRIAAERELEQKQQEEDQQAQTEAHYERVKEGYKSQISAVASTLPDFDDLEPSIRGLLPQIVDANPGRTVEEYIKEAHRQARRANPKTFAKMQAEARAAAQKRRADAVKRADQARIASKVNVTSGGGAAAMTLRQAQDAAFERGMARHNRR